MKSISDSATRAAPFVFVLFCAGLLAWCAHFGEPFNVSGEDGVLEWGTVYFLLVGAILALTAAFKNQPLTPRPRRIFLIVLSVLLVLAAFEEISWGQRLWGVPVPEALAKDAGGMIHVGHGDTSIHNLSFRSEFIRFSIGGVLFGAPLLIILFLHGIWLPVATKREHPLALWLVNRLGVFVPPLELGILMFTASFVFHILKPLESTEAREYKEIVIPLVLVFMLLQSCFDRNQSDSKRASVAVLIATAAWISASVLVIVVP